MFLGYAIFFVNGMPFLMASTTEGAARSCLLRCRPPSFRWRPCGRTDRRFAAALMAQTTGSDTDALMPYRVPLAGRRPAAAARHLAAMHTQQNRPPAQASARASSRCCAFLAPIGPIWVSCSAAISLVRVLQVAGMASANIFFNVYMDQGSGRAHGTHWRHRGRGAPGFGAGSAGRRRTDGTLGPSQLGHFVRRGHGHCDPAAGADSTMWRGRQRLYRRDRLRRDPLSDVSGLQHGDGF